MNLWIHCLDAESHKLYSGLTTTLNYFATFTERIYAGQEEAWGNYWIHLFIYLFIYLAKLPRCMLRGWSMVGIREWVLGPKLDRTACQNAFRSQRWSEKNGINDELSWPWCWIYWIGGVLQRKTCMTQFIGYRIHKYRF